MAGSDGARRVPHADALDGGVELPGRSIFQRFACTLSRAWSSGFDRLDTPPDPRIVDDESVGVEGDVRIEVGIERLVPDQVTLVGERSERRVPLRRCVHAE